MQNAPVEHLQDILTEECPDLRFAYVFGSVAQGRSSEGSDLDIAVDCGEKLDVEKFVRLKGELAKVAGRDVDLVDIHRAGPILRMQIWKTGEVLASPDRQARLGFEMHTPSRYWDWKRQRKPIDESLIRSFQ